MIPRPRHFLVGVLIFTAALLLGSYFPARQKRHAGPKPARPQLSRKLPISDPSDREFPSLDLILVDSPMPYSSGVKQPRGVIDPFVAKDSMN